MLTEQKFDELRKRVEKLESLAAVLAEGHEKTVRVLDSIMVSVERIPEAFTQIDTIANTMADYLDRQTAWMEGGGLKH